MDKKAQLTIVQKVLKEYHAVFTHHVECILNSRILLDEDNNLIMNYWSNLNEYEQGFDYTGLVTYSVAAFGVLASLKSNTLFPSLCATPAVINVCRKIIRYTAERSYKNNFVELIEYFNRTYDLNRRIIEYMQIRDGALPESPTPLLKSGKRFEKSAINSLIKLLKFIKESTTDIANIVPIAEAGYVYTIDWNLEQYDTVDSKNTTEILSVYQKLNDLYVLMVSNFLSCVGLSFCFCLWTTPNWNFKRILDKTIPALLKHLETSYRDTQTHFKNLRFSLSDSGSKHTQKDFGATSGFTQQLHRPLTDVLTHLQIMFEMVKQFEVELEVCDPKLDTERLSFAVDALCRQFSFCDSNLHTFAQMFAILAKRSVTQNVEAVDMPDIFDPVTVQNGANTVLIRHDDPAEFLEDEEYNLSIHGSDDEDFFHEQANYIDGMPTEYLELMLHELKIRLNERKAKKGGVVGNESTEQSLPTEPGLENFFPKRRKSKKPMSSWWVATNDDKAPKVIELDVEQGEVLPPPIPPPLPSFPQSSAIKTGPLPAQTNDYISSSGTYESPFTTEDSLDVSSHSGFLKAVQSVAQKLNRKEEVFGSDPSDYSEEDDD